MEQNYDLTCSILETTGIIALTYFNVNWDDGVLNIYGFAFTFPIIPLFMCCHSLGGLC
jgi:hypothetical protein